MTTAPTCNFTHSDASHRSGGTSRWCRGGGMVLLPEADSDCALDELILSPDRKPDLSVQLAEAYQDFVPRYFRASIYPYSPLLPTMAPNRDTL